MTGSARKRSPPRAATTDQPPLAFACAGCSFVAGLTWDLSRELDRRGIVEMSCLAGLAARRSKFVRQRLRRAAWVVDGCPIECGRGVFEQTGDTPEVHIRLHELGYKKNAPPPGGVDMEALVAQVQTIARDAGADMG